MKILLSVSAIALASVMGAGAAYAADLMVDDVAIEAATADVWTGAYVGANAGAASGTVEWEFAGGGGGDEYDISGWTLGGQIGYNWQMDNIVFGLEADLSVAAINGEYLSGLATRDINWVASARGRVGYAIDSILIYGTAGLAAANSTGRLFGGSFDETNTHLGWTAGLGVEAMVADNVSVKAEYRFSDYGSEEYYELGPDVDTSFSTHTVQVGVNFHF
jgi:outer membrane immunogenic protein